MSDHLDTGGPSAGGLAPDDFADQYNDFSVPDPFAVDLPAAPPSRKRPSAGNAISSLGLGIGLDEEIIVSKKARVTLPKLDESLLLDKDRGIPKLQERAKKLRLKGKGHEYSDVQKMLEMYQLWLDNLWPRSRFLDAAAMVEKLGHKDRIGVARKGWMEKNKILSEDASDDERRGMDGLFDDPTLPPREPGRLVQNDAAIFTNTRELAERQKAERRAREEGTPERDAPDDLDFDDLFDAAPVAKSAAPAPAANRSIFGGGNDDVPSDDDLDALMAEADMNSQPRRPAPATSMFGPRKPQPVEDTQDEETDDLDALLAEQDESSAATKPAQKKTPLVAEEEDYDAMFEDTEKQLNKVVDKAAKGKENMDMGIDEDDLAAMEEMGDMW